MVERIRWKYLSGRSGIVSSLLLTWVIEVGAFGDWVSGDMYNRLVVVLLVCLVLDGAWLGGISCHDYSGQQSLMSKLVGA